MSDLQASQDEPGEITALRGDVNLQDSVIRSPVGLLHTQAEGDPPFVGFKQVQAQITP